MLPVEGEGVGLHCDHCGSERLIPLTFPVYRRKTGYFPDEELVRPMAKCASCGERIYARIMYRDRTPQST